MATPGQVIEMIRSGLAAFPEQPFDPAELKNARKLTVVKMMPRYYNGHNGEALDFMYPYAELEMSADLGSTNQTRFTLNCPTIETGD
jgi:hypothetical protein